jgi:hypothetical protein
MAMGDTDQVELIELQIEAQNAFDELFSEGRITRRVRVHTVKKLDKPHYYALKLFSLKNFVKVFWMEEESFKSFKTAVREAVLRHAK